jgi:hypothetical protein
MIHLFYGTDFGAARSQAKAQIATHTKGGDTLVYLDSNNFTPESLDECVSTQGLFSARCVVDMKDICELAERRDIVLERIEDMAASPNVFVWTERGLDAKTSAVVKKHTQTFKEFAAKAKGKDNAPVTFAFATLCAQKDKKRAWEMYVSRVREESAPEESCGTLIWQYKMIMLAHVSSDAAEVGASPYAYSNAKRLAQKVSKKEAAATLRDLISLYHDAHRGKVDLEAGIERFVLNL